MASETSLNVVLSLLGPIELQVDGERIQVTAAKQRAVLALLAITPRTLVSSGRLIDLVWGADAPANAAKNLQVLIGRLRTAIEPARPKGGAGSIIVSRDDGYVLELPDDAIDTQRFRQLITEAFEWRDAGQFRDALVLVRNALRMWRGRPLGDQADELWSRPFVAQLEELWLAASELRLECLIEIGAAGQAVPEFDELIAISPYRERLIGLKMRALYVLGRQPEALSVYRQFRQLLDHELGLEVAEGLRRLEQAILRQDAALQPAGQEPGARELQAEHDSRGPSDLVGRRAELSELHRLVTVEQLRLVTITGWGGVGKTRLARELVRELRGGGFDRVELLELASLTSADQLGGVLTDALGAVLQDDGSSSMDDVRDAVGGERVLLVLDNMEHLTDARTLLALVSERCPSLTIVITSRVPIGLPSEHVLELEPFAVDLAGAELEVIVASDAVQLFLMRAAQTGASLQPLDADTAAAVAGICARVEGFPLAIELAAVRTRLLSPAQILAKLDWRFELLASTSGDRPARHRSIRATIEWSHDLLSPVEQLCFRRLAVCAGGCTVDVALDILADVDDELTVLDALESLVEHHLLVRSSEPGGETRLVMLDLIEAYARDLVEDDPQVQSVRARHARSMLTLTRAAQESLGRARATGARDRVLRELANIRHALAWCISHDPASGAQLLVHLDRSIGMSRDPRHWLAWVTLVLTRGGDIADAELRGRLRVVAAQLELQCGSVARARAGIDRAASELLEHRDVAGLARLKLVEGELAERSGNAEAARTHLRRAVDLARAADDRWFVAVALRGCGLASHRLGDSDEAAALLLRARDRFEQVGDEVRAADARAHAGAVVLDAGNAQRAVELLQDAADTARAAQAPHVLQRALALLAVAALESAAFAQSWRAAVESLELALTRRRHGSDHHAITALTAQLHQRGHEPWAERMRELLHEPALGPRATRALRIAHDFVTSGSCSGAEAEL